uniref:X8 domain-containing protein n=1 Tax=Strongyloides papillosus TaxID=174720 RepID=A0A0N5BL97_STREA
MDILHILTIFLSIFFAYGGVYDSTVPLEISKVLRNNTKFVSRLPAESSFRTERRFTDSKLYSSPVCYSYSSLNGDWNNGQYDSVTCNYNSLDKCISVVANMGATKYIYLGCASNVLLSEGYDPWAYYIVSFLFQLSN